MPHRYAIDNALDVFTNFFMDVNADKLTDVFVELDSVDAIGALDFNMDLAAYGTFLGVKDFLADDAFIAQVVQIIDRVTEGDITDASEQLGKARVSLDVLIDDKLAAFLDLPRGIVETVELEALIDSPAVMLDALDVLRDTLLDCALDALVEFTTHLNSLMLELDELLIDESQPLRDPATNNTCGGFATESLFPLLPSVNSI